MTESRIKVLIVDDEPLARSLLVELLHDFEDFTVVGECGNGRHAIKAIRDLSPDVIFLDVQMPEMDGLEATGHIRKQDITQPYIVAMTANAMAEDKEICLQAGMDDYLSKPMRLEELMAVLERVKG